MIAPSHLIRTPNAVYERLQSLAEESGLPMGAVVQHLIEHEEERRYWAQFDADYAAVRADPTADAEERQERVLWDAALMDGLENYPYEDRRLTDECGYMPAICFINKKRKKQYDPSGLRHSSQGA
jgi:hypothetical protein